jgi:hypothetical protein
MSFVKRKIDLTILLGTGDYGETGHNTVKLSGLRIRLSTVQTVGATIGQAQLAVYGLTPSLLNQLSALNANYMVMRQNKIIIEAGDEGGSMSVIFAGQIIVGQIDLNNQPDSVLNIVAVAGGFEALKTILPKSYTGAADAADIMRDIAIANGLGFENNGVSKMLSTQYLSGTMTDQLNAIRRAAEIEYAISYDATNTTYGTLSIWPKNGARKPNLIPLISTQTGMVGYPSYSSNDAGLEVTTIFNPNLFTAGLCKIESSLSVANATWRIFSITHNLESETPNGQWFTHFSAAINYAAQ